MNGYDVEAHVEFEIGRLEQELNECREKAEAFEIMQNLIEAQRLRIGHLEQSQKDLRDIRDYYQERI